MHRITIKVQWHDVIVSTVMVIHEI